LEGGGGANTHNFAEEMEEVDSIRRKKNDPKKRIGGQFS